MNGMALRLSKVLLTLAILGLILTLGFQIAKMGSLANRARVEAICVEVPEYCAGK